MILAKNDILWELNQWNRLPNDILFYFLPYHLYKNRLHCGQRQSKIPISDEVFTSVNLIAVCFAILVKIIWQRSKEFSISKWNIIMLGCTFYVQQEKD